MLNVWSRIEAVLRAAVPDRCAALPVGATPAAIAAAERRLGFALPEGVRESYAVHDGSGGADVMPHNVYGLVDVPLLSLEEAIRDRQMWLDFLDRGAFREPRPRGPIRPEWWNRWWVPVTWDGGGDHLCIDLDPAPGGLAGQVIYFSHEEGPLEVVASSWRAFLAGYAADLETGRLRFDQSGRMIAVENAGPGAAPDIRDG
jgi:cell wall assembly regulator SMI1